MGGFGQMGGGRGGLGDMGVPRGFEEQYHCYPVSFQVRLVIPGVPIIIISSFQSDIFFYHISGTSEVRPRFFPPEKYKHHVDCDRRTEPAEYNKRLLLPHG